MISVEADNVAYVISSLGDKVQRTQCYLVGNEVGASLTIKRRLPYSGLREARHRVHGSRINGEYDVAISRMASSGISGSAVEIDTRPSVLSSNEVRNFAFNERGEQWRSSWGHFFVCFSLPL
jgi:hypothetical protein